MVVEAVCLWRSQRPGDERLHFKIVYLEVRTHIEAIHTRNSGLADACEWSLSPININLPEFQHDWFLPSGDAQPDIDLAYICLDDDSLRLHVELIKAQLLKDT